MSKANNPHGFSRPEPNLRFTGKIFFSNFVQVWGLVEKIRSHRKNNNQIKEYWQDKGNFGGSLNGKSMQNEKN